MTQHEEWVFLNGHVVPAEEATVSVFDAGFTHAAGLFETLRAYRGRVMRLDDHVERLATSAATLGLQIPVDKDLIRRGVDDVLQVNNLSDARLRIVLTPGGVPRPGKEGETSAPPTLLITAGVVRAYPPELYKSGMRVCICPYKQNRLDPLAGHKTLAYLSRLMAMKEAADRRCNESLWFTTENRLAEGSVCNVFVVHEKTILTPPLDTPVLPGTVRKAVIELARENELALEEKPIDIETLLAAKEVFLTGSVLEIMPVTSIEKHQVGEGLPGETTQRLSTLYRELVARECGG
ncbi:MAG TPA: aminotransferase class IV [Phycisphaerae bacterium]|nr:aminotransferase class IV [Phycisphaerae bacterium]